MFSPRRLFPPLCALLLLAGCAGTPPPPEEAVAPPQIKRTRGFVADAFRLIAAGSPESLREGFATLDAADDLSDYAQDLRYLASWLYNSLYSALPEGIPEVEPRTVSDFRHLVRDIEQGVYPVMRIEEVSYLFFLLPSLSLRYTDSGAALDTAYESLTAGRELNPEGTLPKLMLGYVEERRGNRAEAITWYISALQGTTECYPAAFGLVRLYIAEHRYAEADVVLSEVEDIINPNPEFYYLSGRTEMGLDRYTAAEENFRAAAAAGGQEPRFLVGTAEALFRQTEYDAALNLLEELRRRGTLSARSMLLEARTLRALEQRLKALTVLERARELFPAEKSLQDLYGQLLLETGRGSEGRLILELESEGSPSDTSHLVLLMKNAIDAGLYEEALIYFEQATEMAREPRVLEDGARLYFLLDQPERALELYAELTERYPERPAYSLELLERALKTGNFEEARAAAESLAEAELSSEEESRLKVGLSLLASDSYSRRTFLEEALFLNVRNTDALAELTDFYLDTGERGRAALYMKQLERMQVDDEEGLERIRRLKERLK